MSNENLISEKIREAIETAKTELLKITNEIAGKKENPRKWSKKEILGHLIDSASNNHQRFVRGAQNIAGDFPTYNQDRWVEIQHYNEMNWNDLVEHFYQYNLHICKLINSLPDNVLDNPCNIGKDNYVTLKFVIDDYLRHLKHHLDKILE